MAVSLSCGWVVSGCVGLTGLTCPPPPSKDDTPGRHTVSLTHPCGNDPPLGLGHGEGQRSRCCEGSKWNGGMGGRAASWMPAVRCKRVSRWYNIACRRPPWQFCPTNFGGKHVGGNVTNTPQKIRNDRSQITNCVTWEVAAGNHSLFTKSGIINQ